MTEHARPKCFYLLVNYEGVQYNPDVDVLMGFASKADRTSYRTKLPPNCTAIITSNQARTFYNLKQPAGTAGVYTFPPRENRVRGRV